MRHVLEYGQRASVRLEFSSEIQPTICAAPRGTEPGELAAAIDAALSAPLGFPPLAQAVTPGDKVALALAAGVPQQGMVVSRIVRALLAASVAAGDITVLCEGQAGFDAATMLALELPADLEGLIAIKNHDSANCDAHSYLAASTDARPLYINRLLHEADLVIPIGRAQTPRSPGYFGSSSTIFPAFMNQATVEKVRAQTLKRRIATSELRKQARELAWLLGAGLVVLVAPARGDGVLSVLCGDAAAVDRAAEQVCAGQLCFAAPARVSLVIATICGPSRQQSWQNVAQALWAARQVVADRGGIALCTELEQEPGPALQQLIGQEDLETALREAKRGKTPDARAAVELIRARRHGPVFFLSRLDDELVENLGMAPVAEHQVANLAARFDSCLALENAQSAVVVLDDAPVAEPRHLKRGRKP
jgi:nickel-dependent lactate racemase